MKKAVKTVLGRMLSASGVLRRYSRQMAPVVVFHRVNDGLLGDGMTCNVRTFRRFCQLFSREFQVVPFGTLANRIERHETIDHMLAITFDDGYRDNYEVAAPILTDFKLPATFFVTSGFIDSDFHPWWDETMGVRAPWMTWRQVADLARAGFEIGAHTRTHIDLGQITGERAWDEIMGSRQDIEAKIEAEIRSFAYPYGRRSQITADNRQLVKQAGFKNCCSCYGGINSAMTDVYSMLRIPIGSWYSSADEFAFEMLTGRVDLTY